MAALVYPAPAQFRHEPANILRPFKPINHRCTADGLHQIDALKTEDIKHHCTADGWHLMPLDHQASSPSNHTAKATKAGQGAKVKR